MIPRRLLRRMPPGRSRRFVAALASFTLALSGVLIVLAAPAHADAPRGFTPVFATNATGDVTIRGNTLETCAAGSSQAQPGGLTCAATQTGGSQQNNNFFMTYVDTDGTSGGNTTFDSSSATVTVPPGAAVLYAGLSWGAVTSAGALAGYSSLSGSPAPNANLKTSALLQAPGAATYSTVTSSTTDVIASTYQAFADVTSTVQAAGSGVYTVANVQAGTGGGNYAGWSLAVAYSVSTMPMRNLVIFTGYNLVQGNTAPITSPLDIPVSGFTTPATGAVKTTVGVVAYEGDKGSGGDSLSIGSTPLFNSLNPVSDVFNASITDLNVAVTDRNPSYANTLGFDVDRFDATGALANGSTSTTIHLTTTGDTYYPGLVTFATDLYASALTATKTVTDTNGPGNVGRNHVLTYSITVTNGGGDGAAATVLTDAAPVGTTYVAGSLIVGGTAVTDAPDTDTGDVNAGNVTARLGTGANGTAGGLLAPNASSTVTFQVKVNSSVADGSTVSNFASFSSNSQTTGTGTAGASNTVTNAVVVPPSFNSTTLTATGEVGAAYSSGLVLNGGTGTAPYVWTISSGTLPAGLSINSSTGLITGTPTAASAPTFTVLVTDANNRSTSRSQSITVIAGPSVTFAPPTGEAGVTYSAQPTVTGGTSPYNWSISAGTLPAGLSINASTGLISGTPTGSGTTNVTVQVVDANNVSATKAVSIVIVAGPALTFAALPACEVTVPYSNQLTYTGGVSTYTWSISSGSLPTGLTLNGGNGLISGTPTVAGSSTFTVKIVDGNGLSDTKAATLVIGPGPTVTFAPPAGEITVAYSAQPTVSGGVGPYTWSVSAGTLPAGLNINASTGLISGTPTASGTTPITVQAVDTNGVNSIATASIVIMAAPTLTFAAPPAGEVTLAYSDQLTVTGGVGPYTWSLSSGTLPAGLTLNPSTGLLSGTPTAAGSSTFTVRIVDANGLADTKSATVVVADVPVLTFAAPPAGEVSVAYSDQLTFTGGVGPFTWSLSAGTLPAGVTLNPGTGLLSGTPTTAGSSTFTVKIVDANGASDTRAATVVISAAPMLTFAAPPAGEVTVAYSDQLTFIGGVGPFTWSISAGTLPTGLSLDPDTGLLSGTPTAAGSSTFTVKIVDGNGLSDTKAATIVVAKKTTTITLSAPASVQFGNPVTLPASVSPTAAGGTVTFTDVPASGPQSGTTVTLGSDTLATGAASVQVTLPAFGVNTITAHYNGDGTHAAADSSTQLVEVTAYAGEVIVTEFRSSGPSGANDSYVELLNTGPTVPLAGIVVSTSSGSSSTLPATAGLLGTGRSYLITGSAFSLTTVATSDYTTTLGTGGIKLTAPDTALTQTDAVGPGTGFHLGTGLPAMTGTPSAQYAWVRREIAGKAVDSHDNAADFVLVTRQGALVDGVQSTLGSASPTGTADPYQHNAGLTSTLLDPAIAVTAAPNRVVVTGTPGTLTVRRTITNTSGATISAAKVRVTALSELHGQPQPGVGAQPATVANLRVINPAAPTQSIRLSSGTTVTVNNLTVDAPSNPTPGGGLNSTLTLPLPDGGLAPGATINVAFTFAIDTRGTFWFGYDIDAITGATGNARHASQAAHVSPHATGNIKPGDSGRIH